MLIKPFSCTTFRFPLAWPLFISLTGLISQPLLADTVWMRNGDRLSGTVRYLSGGKLGLDTRYAGTLNLAWDEVSTLDTSKPVRLKNSTTGEAYLVRLAAAEPGYIWLASGRSSRQKVSAKQLDEFMQAKAKTDALSWKGNIDAGATLKKASTENQNYALSFNSKVSKGKWRHDMGGSYNREKEEQSVSTDNYSLRYALDYRYQEQYFWQGRASYKRDWVEDLSRQALLGTGPGYQLWDDESGALSLSFLVGGFMYGYNDGEEDRHYGASLRWSYQKYLLGKNITLYSNGDTGHALGNKVFMLDAEVGMRYAITPWSTLNIGYHHDLVSGTRDTLNERRFTTGLGVKW